MSLPGVIWQQMLQHSGSAQKQLAAVAVRGWKPTAAATPINAIPRINSFLFIVASPFEKRGGIAPAAHFCRCGDWRNRRQRRQNG
jgi:hypothetical protein